MAKQQPWWGGRFGLVMSLSMLAAMVGLGALMLTRELPQATGVNDRQQEAAAPPPSNAGRPGTEPTAEPRTAELMTLTVDPPWLRPSAEAVLTRIAVASCLHQDHPMPILADLIAAKPDLLLMLGDNVYGDIRAGDPNELARAYAKQLGRDEVVALRRVVPVLATWDDHDYGLNDGGAGWEFQREAAELFRSAFQLPEAQSPDGGISYSQTVGPEGRRIQLIFLDTRSFRSPLKPKSEAFPHWGKYEPDADPAKTLLGEAQWAWLEAELRKPADLRIIASSIQVLANGHGWERWGNLPLERDRLMRVVAETGARGVVFVSGDRHSGAIFDSPQQSDAGDFAIVELTSSSLNRSYGPSRDERMAPLVSEIFHQENFGIIEVDWDARALTLKLQGIGGDTLAEYRVTFEALGLTAG